MPILTPRWPAKLSGLDSAAIADGRGPSAHVLRTLEGNANRLQGKLDLAARLSFSSAGTFGETLPSSLDAFFGWGVADQWVPISPWIEIKRKPWHNRYRLLSSLKVTANSIHLIQVESTLHPFDPSAGTGRPFVLTIEGGGSDGQVDDDLTFAAPGATEDRLKLWLKSMPLDDLMSEGTYGANNEGTISDVTQYGPGGSGAWILEDDTSTWNTGSGSSTPSHGGHAIAIHEANGTVIMPPARIISNSATTITFSPASWRGLPISSMEIAVLAAESMIGQEYSIYKLPEYQVLDLAIYSEERQP